jgi:hypothetical protein
MQTVVIRSILKLLIPGLCIALFTAVSQTHARPAYAVELISFEGIGLPNGVRLTWETATEQSVAGFRLQRSQGSGDFVTLTDLYDANGQPYLDGIIEAQGSPTLGATYIADDFTAVPGQTYTYRLMEIEGDNNENPLETIIVTAGGQPTATSITIGTPSNPTSAPQNTPTSTPQTSPTGQSLTATATVLTGATATRPLATAAPTQATANNNTNPPAANTAVSPADSAIPLPEPVSPPNELDNVVLAQTLETPTTAAYPGTDTTSAPEAYPEGTTAPLPASEATPTAYPASAFSPNEAPTPTIIGVIGGNVAGIEESEGTAVQTSTSSTGLLWIGFLGGLLIFIAAIAGSILLFVRRRE